MYKECLYDQEGVGLCSTLVNHVGEGVTSGGRFRVGATSTWTVPPFDQVRTRREIYPYQVHGVLGVREGVEEGATFDGRTRAHYTRGQQFVHGQIRGGTPFRGGQYLRVVFVGSKGLGHHFSC